MRIKFRILGGGNEIGANSFLLKIGNEFVVLDSGMHPRKKGLDMFPDFELIQNEIINHLIISHAHNDHIGSLPYFLKFFPYAKAHTTKPTLSIAEVSLMNTASIIERDFDDPGHDELMKYYNEEILNIIPMIIRHYGYKEKIHITPEIFFEFFDAGHILGSASVLLTAGDKTIFYTGDINMRNQALIPKAEIPKRKVDVLILECTNGESAALPDYKSEESRLAKFINEIISKGGSVLIPSFAIGKSQELLTRVENLKIKNRIPDVPVYISPMANELNSIYDRYNYTINRIEKGYKLSRIEKRILRKQDIRTGEFYKNPSILIATSGMMTENTSSYRLARNFLRRKNFGIAFCGYCDPESPGYIVKNAQRYSKIYLNSIDSGIDVLCDIENFKFSSHSDKKGLIEIAQILKPDKTILVHGSPEARNEIGKELLELFRNMKIYSPEPGRDYDI